MRTLAPSNLDNEDRQVIDLCDRNNFRREWADDVEREQEMRRITGMARLIAEKRRRNPRRLGRNLLHSPDGVRVSF